MKTANTYRSELEASVSTQVTKDGDSYIVRGALPVYAVEVLSLSSTPEELEAAQKRVRDTLVNAALGMEL